VDGNTFSDHNSKSAIFSLFAETMISIKQKLFKKEFTRVDHIWLLFLEVLDPNAPKKCKKVAREISIAIYLGPIS